MPFRVNSIDIVADDAKGALSPSLVGKLNGKVQWTISPKTDHQFHTYREATSGDLSLPIDVIEWNTGVATNPGGAMNNLIDNLNITIVE